MGSVHNISVVFVTDKNYKMPTWVVARSLLESKKSNVFIDVYIIGDRLEVTDKNELITIVDGIDDANVLFIDVDSKNDFNNMIPEEELKRWSPAVLYKFLLCDLLPKTLKRVIYLDGDMLVRKDLSELFETDLEGCVLGAVRDTFYDNIAHEERMNLQGTYFNTGCLLLDLDKMRQDGVATRLIKTKHDHPELGLADQDTYNEVCRGRVKILSCKYNFFITSFFMNENIEGFKKYTICPYSEREEMIEDIAIIHMIHYRPWKLRVNKTQVKQYFNEIDCVPSICESVIGYVLGKWIQLYAKSPYYLDSGENLMTHEDGVTLTKEGLLSYVNLGPMKFSVLQNCELTKIHVKLALGRLRLITKMTDVTNNTHKYKFL